MTSVAVLAGNSALAGDETVTLTPKANDLDDTTDNTIDSIVAVTINDKKSSVVFLLNFFSIIYYCVLAKEAKGTLYNYCDSLVWT